MNEDASAIAAHISVCRLMKEASEPPNPPVPTPASEFAEQAGAGQWLLNIYERQPSGVECHKNLRREASSYLETGVS